MLGKNVRGTLLKCTIKENRSGVNLHPKLPRVLTAREMARLQSFPDDFIFEGKKNKQLVQIGNAVPPLLGKAIGLAVRYSNHAFTQRRIIFRGKNRNIYNSLEFYKTTRVYASL